MPEPDVIFDQAAVLAATGSSTVFDWIALRRSCGMCHYGVDVPDGGVVAAATDRGVFFLEIEGHPVPRASERIHHWLPAEQLASVREEMRWSPGATNKHRELVVLFTSTGGATFTGMRALGNGGKRRVPKFVAAAAASARAGAAASPPPTPAPPPPSPGAAPPPPPPPPPQE